MLTLDPNPQPALYVAAVLAFALRTGDLPMKTAAR
jgi:hypothetical protein